MYYYVHVCVFVYVAVLRFICEFLGLVGQEQAQTEKVGPVLRQHPPVQCYIPHSRGTSRSNSGKSASCIPVI